MTNPFDNKDDKDPGEFNYSEFIRDQLKHLEISESCKVDTGTKNGSPLRLAVYRAGISLDRKFRTKTDENGGIWVKRFK